jgi:peptidoglycan/LPS O-acetylase OafA/YrhL
MVVIPHVLRRLSVLNILTVPLGNTIQGVGLTVLILQSVILPDWGIYKALNWSFVAWIGTLSYSLYIWQQLFCTSSDVFGLPAVWWLSFPGWLVPTFLTALVSYYGLEKPFLRLRARLRAAP